MNRADDVPESSAASDAFALPPLDRLPSGRHRLSREAVKESQRGRLLAAIAHVVAERGYAAATVADIVDRASVSRSTFYEQFEDKEACFIAAFDYGVAFVLRRMEKARDLAPRDDWRALVTADFSTYLSVLANERAFARALHVEILAAGPVALARRAQVIAMFSGRTQSVHRDARHADRSLPDLPDTAFALHAGGVDELIRGRLLADPESDLSELIEPVVRATLLMLGSRGV